MGLARRLIRQPGSSSSPPHPGAQGPPHPGAPSSPPREHLLPTREYPPPWRGAPSPRSGSCSSRGGEVALPGGELRLPGGEAALPGGEAALPGWEAALPGWGERLSRVGSSVLPGGERCSPHPGSTLLRVGRGPKTREFRLPGRANRGELLPGFWPPPGVGRALSRGWGEGRIFEVSGTDDHRTPRDTAGCDAAPSAPSHTRGRVAHARDQGKSLHQLFRPTPLQSGYGDGLLSSGALGALQG